jgi:hypothetical protein
MTYVRYDSDGKERVNIKIIVNLPLNVHIVKLSYFMFFHIFDVTRMNTHPKHE